MKGKRPQVFAPTAIGDEQVLDTINTAELSAAPKVMNKITASTQIAELEEMLYKAETAKIVKNRKIDEALELAAQLDSNFNPKTGKALRWLNLIFSTEFFTLVRKIIEVLSDARRV